MSDWQPIKDCYMTPGSEIVVKLKRNASAREAGFWHGRSIHQIGTWSEEGELWSQNHEIPLELVEGYIFIPE